MDQSETRFAWNGDVALAYQVVGSGEHDLLYLPGFMSNIDVMWEWPPYERFLRRLSSFARLILMDRRGYGCSERYAPDAVAPLEVLVDDALVVLDAAEASKAAVFAFEEATFLAVLLAAARPERVSHLVLQTPTASFMSNEELPWEWTSEQWEEQLALFRRTWGITSPEHRAEDQRMLAEQGRPDEFDEHEFRWLHKMERATMGPGALVAETRKFMDIDVRSVLPTIHVPTLVLHRRGAALYDARSSRYVADHIVGATYVEVDSGMDSWPLDGGVGGGRRRDRGVRRRHAARSRAEPDLEDRVVHRHRRIE